jgi:RimJ/RimL family protein N-acetyltransferase
MIVRPAAEADFGRFAPLLAEDPASSLTPDKYRARLGLGTFRPEWTWLAEDETDGKVRAAAVFWGFPGNPSPGSLDTLVAADAPDRVAVAARLIGAAHAALAATPDYHVFLPANWRDEPAAVAAFGWREEAARQAGYTKTLERLSYRWTPGDGLPPASTRLMFRPEPDDEVFAGLFRQVLEASLDATSTGRAGEIGADAQAREDLAFLREKMLGERSWWRIALAPDGAVAGFAVPSRNTEMHTVGYLGVLPAYRGHGYATDILAEITRILVTEAGTQLIGADTDLANRPMAAAFARVGYRTVASHLVLSVG